ncbi:hypothetical protein TL16_g01349 [Triparma laevis f. inornata]|uniref:subtilisin n=1 Tax=Triparma laevis f. inornata TaxID=1714386 RepID=A0A9W7DW80_9STRA|nr:hypothetical protein TL16_g01349 [Triparma laevis f. inornata]
MLASLLVLLVLVAPTSAQDLSTYCPDAIRTLTHTIPYEAYRTFRSDYSLEYCVLHTTMTDPNTDSTTTKDTPSALSQAMCAVAGGTWTHRPSWEDESGSGGLTTTQKYLCAVSTFELMENKCTYMAMSDDRSASVASVRGLGFSDLDMTNFQIYDEDSNPNTKNKIIFTLSLTAAEYSSMITAQTFTHLQPVLHNVKVSPILESVDANAALRVRGNSERTATQLKEAIATFAPTSQYCMNCEVTISEDFTASTFSVNEVMITGTTNAAAFAAALTVDHDATGLITSISADMPNQKWNDEASWILQSGNKTRHTPFWDRGILGTGVVAGVGDSGLDYQSCYFYDESVEVTFSEQLYENAAHRKVVQYVAFADAVEGENGGHGTHVSGTIAGNSLGGELDGGMAPNAKIAFYDIGNPNAQFLTVPGNLAVSMFPPAHRMGAQLHSNSWGSSSNSYSGNARQIDEYSYEHQDFLVLVAAGNSGSSPGTLGSPATAKNCVSVGATQNGDNSNDLAGFSSRGPAFDNRIKPDVVAPGLSVTSANSIPTPTDGHCSRTNMAGTSMATPATTGILALAQQYFVDGYYPSGKKTSSDGFKPMGALLKAVIVNSAQRLTGANANAQGTGYPNMDQGFGIVELDATLNFDSASAKGLFLRGDFGNMPEFLTAEDPPVEHEFVSTCEDVDFRATLVWHDPPSQSSNSKSLLNDLDILVTSEDGTSYYPNGGTARDSVNNVESVSFTPEKGKKYKSGGGGMWKDTKKWNDLI